MHIAVDLDGVCYEWQRTYRYMMRTYRGVEMPEVHEFWHEWDAQKQFGESDDHKWMWIGGVMRGLFRYGHMVQGCRVGLDSLVADGHSLSIVTTRPRAAAQDTMEWITFFFKGIPLEGIHILPNKLKTSVEWDLIIDDKPEVIEDAWLNGRKAVLFQQPWNATYEIPARDVTVAYGWPQVKGAVDALR